MPAHKHLKQGKSDLMKRKNELWYLRRLKIVSEEMQSEVAPKLRALADSLPKTSDEASVGEKAMLTRQAQEIISKARESFVMPIDPKRTSRFAATLNLQSTDAWLKTYFKQQGIAPIQLVQPPMRVADAAPKGSTLSKKQLEELMRQQVAQAKRQKAQLGLQVGSVRPLSTLSMIAGTGEVEFAFQTAVATNVGLITSIPEQYFDRLTELVFENVEGAQRWETLASTLKESVSWAANLADYRVNLIARDQTAKMASAFNEARSASVGITQYTWQTAGDERVRETHAANDGQLFAFDDPPDETGNPGNDINCRCVALPYVEEVDDLSEDGEAAA
jgi:SPP1 gp7 family putative phage head morphogenesis protein